MSKAEIIATLVHGWKLQMVPDSDFIGTAQYEYVDQEGHFKYIDSDFDPENNDTQAIAALEAWDESAVYNYYVIQSWPNKVVKLYHGAARVATEGYKNKSLSAAIVEALVVAVGEGK